MPPALRFARLTACSPAGITVFRLRGDAVAAVLGRMFVPNGAAPIGAGQIRVGRLVDRGAVLDDAVVRTRSLGAGLEAEISVHGSTYLAERVATILASEGGAPLSDDEAWSMDAAGGDGADPLTADARSALLASFADRQAAFFLAAARGGLGRDLRAIAASAAAAATPGSALAVRERLAALARRAALGLAMSEPPEVVLAGTPNAGKSSLFNALLGEERAIVFPEPGTTRDVVAEPVAIAGLPFRLSDTAGVRAVADAVERLGVAKAREAVASADIVVVLVDPEADLDAQADFARGCAPPHRRIAVVSKADLPGAAAAAAHGAIAALGPGMVSSRTGAGIASLRDRLVRASAFGGPADARQAAPFLPRHAEVIARATRALEQGQAPGAAAILRELVAADP
jgi:tRNA modification GTPase